MYELFIIFVILIGCIGLMLYFVGWINCIFMALGKDKKIQAVVIFIVNPIAIYFCMQNWQDEKKQGLQMICGLLIMVVTVIPSYLYIQSLK
ncbi:MAG: hypothetical protein AB8B80_13100 [Marinicellaceae bacterium]